MNDIVISVRVPKNLVSELKKMTIQNHYLDLSEQIRDIVRERSLKKIKEYNQVSKSEEFSHKEKLVTDLLKIMEELKK